MTATMAPPLVKIPDSKASQISARCSLLPPALRLLDAAMTPARYIETLKREREYVAGIEFLSHALPAREAVWWACLCIQHAFGDTLEAGAKAACQAAVQWVLKPTEENRKIAKAHADALGNGGAVGLAAAAAGIAGASSGALSSARAAGNAVKLASIHGDPVKIPDTQRRFVDLGLGVAAGRYM